MATPEGSFTRPFPKPSQFPRWHDREPLETTAVIPYIHRVSKPIRRILAPLNIRTCFRPHWSLRNILTRVKDPIVLEDRTGCVTNWQALSHHLKEHKQALRNATPQPLLWLNMPSTCSGHTNAWDEALVIDSNPHLHPQCALEAWHIRSQPHPQNWECGNLSPA